MLCSHFQTTCWQQSGEARRSAWRFDSTCPHCVVSLCRNRFTLFKWLTRIRGRHRKKNIQKLKKDEQAPQAEKTAKLSCAHGGIYVERHRGARAISCKICCWRLGVQKQIPLHGFWASETWSFTRIKFVPEDLGSCAFTGQSYRNPSRNPLKTQHPKDRVLQRKSGPLKDPKEDPLLDGYGCWLKNLKNRLGVVTISKQAPEVSFDMFWPKPSSFKSRNLEHPSTPWLRLSKLKDPERLRGSQRFDHRQMVWFAQWFDDVFPPPP